MKKTLSALTSLLICVAFFSEPIVACTTAIVSGRYTTDGRPLLFKQRDTQDLENKITAFSDGKYLYFGLVNTIDTLGKDVFGGFNNAGFAIMNSASYNLNLKDQGNDVELDGSIMKLALQRCASLADFERLLDSLPRPLKVSSNFGVIDAKGGAAYYETGNYKYTKYDANDPNIAPLGYIIRTNFSYSGDRSLDKGLSRYLAAQDLLYQASLTNSFSVNFFISVSRSLKHGLTKTNLYDIIPANANEPVFSFFRDYIPRYLTASAIIIQGINKSELPNQTMMWTILGSPLTTVAIPLWITSSLELPKILIANSVGKASLNEWSLQLKKQLFPIERGEGVDYINIAALLTNDQKGILQKIIPLEKQIQNQASGYQNKWRASGTINEKELSQFYNWVDKFVSQSYHDNFDLPTILELTQKLN
jgi:hypothetical protein